MKNNGNGSQQSILHTNFKALGYREQSASLGRQLLTYEPTRSAYYREGVGFKEISEWYSQKKEKLVPCNECPRDLFTKRYFEQEKDKFSASGKMV